MDETEMQVVVETLDNWTAKDLAIRNPETPASNDFLQNVERWISSGVKRDERTMVVVPMRETLKEYQGHIDDLVALGVDVSQLFAMSVEIWFRVLRTEHGYTKEFFANEVSDYIFNELALQGVLHDQKMDRATMEQTVQACTEVMEAACKELDPFVRPFGCPAAAMYLTRMLGRDLVLVLRERTTEQG